MSTGASAAKRNARRQQTAAYMKALESTERAPEVQNISTNAARTLRQNNPNIDYSAVRMAIKADRIARETNTKLPQLNEAVGLYNKRFDQLQRQRAGESIVDGYIALGTGQNLMGHQVNQGVFRTQAEAVAASNAARNISGFGGLLGGGRSQNSILGLTQPTVGAQPIMQGPIDGGYRNLAQTQDAYEDMKSLTENVTNKANSLGINANNTQYEALANRIRASVKRNTNQPQATGLLQSEVLTGQPTSEVIR